MIAMRRIVLVLALCAVCAATLLTLQAYRGLPMQTALQGLLALCGH
jgi:hypothetical protein